MTARKQKLMAKQNLCFSHEGLVWNLRLRSQDKRAINGLHLLEWAKFLAPELNPFIKESQMSPIKSRKKSSGPQNYNLAPKCISRGLGIFRSQNKDENAKRNFHFLFSGCPKVMKCGHPKIFRNGITYEFFDWIEGCLFWSVLMSLKASWDSCEWHAFPVVSPRDS